MSSLHAAAGLLASWVLTYAVHSLVACATGLVVARFATRRFGARDWLWKAVLLTPLVTSSVRVAVPVGRPFAVADLVRSLSPVVLPGPVVTRLHYRDPSTTLVVRRVRRVRDPVAEWTASLICAFAASVVLVAIVRFLRRRRALRQELSDASPIALDQQVTASLSTALHGLTVLAAPRLTSPTAIGRHTICVPRDTFAGLTAAQQAGVLAHEAAHLRRGDPQWIQFAELLAGVTAFQPLLRPVIARMRRDIELLCDTAALRLTGSPAPLVEALAVFAANLETGRGGLRFSGSPAVERAYRLLHDPADDSMGVGAGSFVLLATLLATALLLPPTSLRPGALRGTGHGPAIDTVVGRSMHGKIGAHRLPPGGGPLRRDPRRIPIGVDRPR